MDFSKRDGIFCKGFAPRNRNFGVDSVLSGCTSIFEADETGYVKCGQRLSHEYGSSSCFCEFQFRAVFHTRDQEEGGERNIRNS